MSTISVATRISSEQLAKARDGLIVRGIAPEDIMTKSSILRMSLYLAITMTPNPDDLPSEESLSVIQ